MNLLKSAVAEAVGTFFLCFIGGGAIVINAHLGASGPGLLGIAIAHGLALAIAVSATMKVSGGQINPAITIGLIVIGKETPAAGGIKVIGQLVGAVLAGFLLVSTFPSEAVAATGNGTPALGAGITPVTGVALETVATFILAFAIYGTAVGSNAPQGLGGFGIGLTVAFLILAIGPLTGAAMNPMRHLGTGLPGGALGDIWVYWVGPIIGAVLGLLTARFALEPAQES